MLGNRIYKANLKAKKRYCNWYPDDNIYHPKRFGSLRKTNVMCSCDMCGNLRRSRWASKKEKLTMQERKAAQIDEWD